MVADDLEVLEPYVSTPMATFFAEDNDVDGTTNDLMTCQDYHVLNKKLDYLLRHARTLSTSNFENVVTLHQGVIQALQSKIERILVVKKS